MYIGAGTLVVILIILLIITGAPFLRGLVDFIRRILLGV